MELDFWHERWKNDQIGFHQEQINRYLQKYWQVLGVTEGSCVFVPLAGKTKDILWLNSQGFHVKAIELSELAVKAFFVENSLEYQLEEAGQFNIYRSDNIEFYCGDFFALEKSQLADIAAVYDRASLIALPPAMRSVYEAKLKSILPDAVKILLVTMEYPQQEMDGPPFSVMESEVRQLFEDQFSIEVLENFDVIADNPRFADRGLSQMFEKVYCLSKA